MSHSKFPLLHDEASKFMECFTLEWNGPIEPLNPLGATIEGIQKDSRCRAGDNGPASLNPLSHVTSKVNFVDTVFPWWVTLTVTCQGPFIEMFSMAVYLSPLSWASAL